MFSALSRLSLVSRIIIAIILGVGVALLFPEAAPFLSLLGDLFIKALKSVAPVLVFILVLASIANFQVGQTNSTIRPIMLMYAVGMFLAALSAVIASILFPSTLFLDIAAQGDLQPPGSLGEILKNLVLSFVANPVVAIAEANFIGILAWSIALGIAFRHASHTTKTCLNDAANAINYVIRLVISFAPVGIFGLVAVTFAEAGLDTLTSYAHLLAVLLGTMVFVALVINPLMVGFITRRNPYPLVFTCLRESGITAFFTRSSAANIPVNLDLAKRLGVKETTSSVAIPLGATINMAGASVTITVLSLAAVNTLGVNVDFTTMLILSIVATVSACGFRCGWWFTIADSGSLWPVRDFFRYRNASGGNWYGDQCIAGSTETALNSSTDVLFTTAVDRATD